MSSPSLFGGKSKNRKGAEQKIDSEYLSFITENETIWGKDFTEDKLKQFDQSPIFIIWTSDVASMDYSDFEVGARWMAKQMVDKPLRGDFRNICSNRRPLFCLRVCIGGPDTTFMRQERQTHWEK